MSQPVNVQCTALAIEGRGVVLTGAPGAGKSELALRLVDGGATLIGDDLVAIAFEDGRLVAAPVSGQAGSMFVAGIGPVILEAAQPPVPLSMPVPLSLCVMLDPARLRSDRMAELGAWQALPGRWLPRIILDTGPAAPNKVRLALRLWGH
ncbi:MAG: hypothetical protein K2X31_03500 [Sphingopyxis sp.]|nr:hypothetical protein [Sphingopyxis sp.]